MAREQDPAFGRPRLLALLAVAGLAAATAFAFGRIFLGRLPTLKLIAAALAAVLLAAALERRGLTLALLASVAGLALAVTWLVLPQTTWYGLPSLRTLRAVGRCLELVGQQARVQASPTPPLPPLMLASVTAIWTAAFSAHALVVRAGSPLLAVLPSVALVGFTDAVMEDGTRPVYAITVLGAALVVVFADGIRRIRQWGPIWVSRRTHRPGRLVSQGARRAALVSVAAAVLLPGLLPGFRSQALVDISAAAGAGVRLDPFVSILAQLEGGSAIDLFEVTTEGPGAYWRLYALDRFDGATWSSSDLEAREGRVFATPARLPTEFPPDSQPLPQRFRVLRDIGDPWVPMAYPPVFVTMPAGTFRYDAELGVAALDGGLGQGLEYTVTSRVVAPSGEQLDAVTFGEPSRYGRYTFVPGNVDPEVERIASEWTDDASTPYRKVLAIQERFLDGSFLYTLDVEPVADADAMVDFLTNSRRGFCQQFATAMALLVRELGLPARVVVGYRPGTVQEGAFLPRTGGSYLVRTNDAHAWVEVFFPGYGWLPFEPTPGRVNPLAEPGSYLDPVPPADAAAGGAGAGAAGELDPGAGASCTDATGRPLPGQLCNADPIIADRPFRGSGGGPLPPGLIADPSAPVVGDRYAVPYRTIFLVLVLLGAIVLVLVPIAKGLWRRLLIRRSREPRARVLAAYRVFAGEAADLGMGRRPGETLEEHRERLRATVSFSDGHLDRLTRTTSRVAYSPREPTSDDARTAVADARTALRDLRRSVGWVRRVAGTYRPGL